MQTVTPTTRRLTLALAVITLLGLACGLTRAESATRIQEGGRYPKYNATVARIAFDMRVTDFGNTDVYVMNPDGSGVQKITDNTPGLRHKGQPSWYPDGQYLIFTAEQDGYDRNSLTGYVEQPGLGRNNNVWIMRADGSAYWKMTEVQENGSYIRASFSHDGTKVMWNEEYSMEMDPAGCSWKGEEPTYPGWEGCHFRIVWGDFELVDGVPQVTNVHEIEFFDEEGWAQNHTGDNGLIILEAQGFSRDDQRIVFSACDPYEVWQETGNYSCLPGGDLYTTDLEGTELVRLTDSVPGHEENAEYSPDGTRIIYTRTPEQVGIQPEWYVMRADGSDYPGAQVTFFADPDNPDYIENVFRGEGDWLDEETVVLNAPYWRAPGGIVRLYSDIYRIAVPPPTPSPYLLYLPIVMRNAGAG